MIYYLVGLSSISFSITTAIFLGVFGSFTVGSLKSECSVLVEWQICLVSGLDFSLPLYFDFMSCLFMVTVGLVSCSVFAFSQYYMMGDKHETRFASLVCLFVVSMFFFILTPNLLIIFLGWDGLGVTSFLLVAYYQKAKSVFASVLTILTNRVGDILLVILVGMVSQERSFSFLYDSRDSYFFCGIISISLVLAAFTKSAQVPFSAWLPAAMAAPTPVSALVHSSTLVTAGVFLVIRCSEKLVLYSSQSLVLLISSLTVVSATLYAIFELDMKKIVAWSTLSQIGLMMMALGIGSSQVAFFHLLMHAFFKALLFITVGYMIHLVGGYQDLRMNTLSVTVKKAFTLMVVSTSSLMGMPFMTGFFSKDFLIETGLSLGGTVALFMVWLFSVLGTGFYSGKLLSSVWSKSKTGLSVMSEEDWQISLVFSMLLLLIPSVFLGSMFVLMGFHKSQPLLLAQGFKMSVLFLMSGGFFLGVQISHKMGEMKKASSVITFLQQAEWVSGPNLGGSTFVTGKQFFNMEWSWENPFTLITQYGDKKLVWWERLYILPSVMSIISLLSYSLIIVMVW